MRRHRTCGACAATWSARDRFCGRCGSHLVEGPPASSRTGARLASRAWVASRAWLRPAVATIIVAVALVVVAPRLSGSPGIDASDVGLPSPAEVPEPPPPVIEVIRDGPVCRGRPEPISCVRWVAEVARRDRADVALHTAGLAVATTDGRITVHDRRSGDVRWSTDVGTDPRLWPGVAGTVPVTSTFAAEGPWTTFFTSEHGREVGGFGGPVDAAAPHGRWLLVAGDGELAAREVTGNAAWVRDVADEDVWLTPGGAHVGGPGEELALISSATGDERWRVVLPGPVLDVVRPADNTVVTTGGDHPAVVTIDPSGRVVWIADLDVPARWLTTDAAGHTVAAVTEQRAGARLHLVDGASGKRRATVELGERVTSTVPAAVSHDIVAVAHAGPTPALTVVDGADGTVHYQRSLERYPAFVGIPRGDTVVVTDARGAWSWSLATGHLRWRIQLGETPLLVAAHPLIVTADRGVVALDAAPGVPLPTAEAAAPHARDDAS